MYNIYMYIKGPHKNIEAVPQKKKKKLTGPEKSIYLTTFTVTRVMREKKIVHLLLFSFDSLHKASVLIEKIN